MQCKHCGEPIRRIPSWRGEPDYQHYPDDGLNTYSYCRCKCDACKEDTTLGIHDPCPANCCDGEEAEPNEPSKRRSFILNARIFT
jgi:hypothetical protein